MADTMIVSCPKCSAKMSVPTDYIGIEGHCLKCKHPFMICEPEKPAVSVVQPPAAKATPQVTMGLPPAFPMTPIRSAHSMAHSFSMSGWICFFIGMVLLVLCPIIPFYFPFILASFVLAIVLLMRKESNDGLALLLMTLLMPTAVGAVIFMLGVGAALSAFSGFTKELANTQKTLVTQQTTALNQLSGQQAQYIQPVAPQSARPRPVFLQPPAALVQPPAVAPVQPPAASVQPPPAAVPLPAREVSYDGLLRILNKYGDEYKSAGTTVQRTDVRARAQKEAATFVESARMTLEGKVRDVQFGDDGKADLLFSDFAAPGSVVKANHNLSYYSFGKLPVPITREEALAIKPGQKVWITGRPFLVAHDNIGATLFVEGLNPSLITYRFSLDIVTLMTLRMRDYTVSFEETRAPPAPAAQSAPRVKKPYSLIVVSPKASP